MVKMQLLTLSALQQCARPSKQLAKYYRNFVCKFVFKNRTRGRGPVSELIKIKVFLIVIICAKMFLSSTTGRHSSSL